MTDSSAFAVPTPRAANPRPARRCRPGTWLRRAVRTAMALGWLSGSAALVAVPATAQEQASDPRIGPLVVDVRGSFPRFKQDSALAAPFGLSGTDLPSRGIGLDVGAHWYPFTVGPMTLGIGGDVLIAAGHKGPRRAGSTVQGADLDERFLALSPQVSFNFGRSKGWSYLSGGLGPSRLELSTPELMPESTPMRKTINYGGGARWFLRDHLAFSLDIRFYAINPQPETATTLPAPRLTLFVLSAGVSFK